MGSLLEQLNVGIWLGLILQLVGRFVTNLGPDAGLFGLAIIFLGAVIFVWGCMRIAAEKGYSKWLGLLGLLSCIGLLILLVLPERN